MITRLTLAFKHFSICFRSRGGLGGDSIFDGSSGMVGLDSRSFWVSLDCNADCSLEARSVFFSSEVDDNF